MTTCPFRKTKLKMFPLPETNYAFIFSFFCFQAACFYVLVFMFQLPFYVFKDNSTKIVKFSHYVALFTNYR